MMNERQNVFHRHIWFLIAVLFGNLLLVSSQIVLPNDKSLIHNIGLSVIAPFQKVLPRLAEFVISTGNKYVFLRKYHRKFLAAEQEIRDLKQEKAWLVRRLKEMKYYSTNTDGEEDHLVAEVVMLDVGFPLNTLWIDRGRTDGLVKNLPVLTLDGHLVGKTTEPIGRHTAKVRMITSSVGGVGAYIESNRLEGFLTGQNGPVCLFKYVIGMAPVRVGDSVVTSGTDRIFPPFIPVGKVKSVEGDYPEKTIEVDPYFIHRSLKYLMVMTENE